MGGVTKILRKIKLRNRLMLSYLLTCLVPLLLTTMIIHSFAVNNLEEESMELTVLYSSQIVSNIENRVDEYDRISRSVLVDNETLARIAEMENPGIGDEIDNRLRMRRLLMRIAMMQPDIDNIMFWFKNGSFYQYTNGSMSVNEEALKKNQWILEMQESEKVLTISPAHFKDYYESQNDEITVTIGRRIFDSGGKELGLLLMDMSPFQLVEMNDTYKQTRSRYHIGIHAARRTDGAVLYDSGVVSGEKTWQQALEEEKNPGEYREDAIVITDSAHDGEFIVQVVIPREELMGKASRITFISLLAIGISACMIIGLSVILSRTITKPITELQRKMERTGDGDYARVEADITSDEIGILIQHYNHMVEKIQTLVDDVYLAEIRQRDARLTALRTQINPHMLYNTLESIRMKAVVKGDAEVAEMIKILARMFRVSLGKEDGRNTIRRELEYVENYVKLQNVRFQGRFEYEFHGSEEILDTPVVPLVFQPIVENCMEHGYRGRHEKLKIELQLTRLDDHTVSVIFRDNGKGMTKERLREIQEELEQPDSGRITPAGESGGGDKSIGLKNIAERIRLRYGKAYFVKVLESGEQGTVIELRLPAAEGLRNGEENV